MGVRAGGRDLTLPVIPPWVHRRALLGPEDRESIMAVTGHLFERPVVDPAARVLWQAAELRNTAHDRVHPLDQPGGHGLALPAELSAWPLIARRVREWLADAAREMRITVGAHGMLALGREHHAVVMRYPPRTWLEEHTDTPMSSAPEKCIKLSATVRLAGPQTVAWGHMPVCELALGDAVAWPAWRRHYVPPSDVERTSLTLSLFGPMWR